MSQPHVCARMSEDLRIVLDLNAHRSGFTSRSAYLKYLVRRDAMSAAETDVAALVAKVNDAAQDDFDAALLRIVEAKEEKRPSLLAILAKALLARLKPSNRRELGWNRSNSNGCLQGIMEGEAA